MPFPPVRPLAKTRARRFLDTLLNTGAGDRIRTGDIKLGKLALYQLSYTRVEEKHTATARKKPRVFR